MNVIFMGTPDFAAASLNALAASRHNVQCVFTNPDRPKGRGMEMSASPVKEVAIEHSLKVYQPEKLRGNSEVEDIIRSYNPDVLAVVAYGKLIPDSILEIPKHGAINVHGSLLPRYRGASPIQSAVLNCDDISGVTTMYLSSEMDCGDIVYSKSVPIREYETSGELFEELMPLGAELLVKTLDDIEAGIAPRIPQNDEEACVTGLLDKSNSPIDFNRCAKAVIRQIYGLQPWPVATAQLGDKVFRIWAAEYTGHTTKLSPGSVISSDSSGIEMACGNNETVLITELQAPGKKRVKVKDYLAGNKI